ncbi:MAG: hypothetical protein EBU07_01255 [Betaproteobacteria bacterium]|jgi:hypothetical protein|nr:hypothetical protein [Betaproteobacteria bacterium]
MMQPMRRLMIVLLMVLALPARMAWADVMPIRMAAAPDMTPRVQTNAATTDQHAHCHGAVDEAAHAAHEAASAASDAVAATDASGDTGHDTAACAKCTVCHGLAIVTIASVRGALACAAVLQVSAPQRFSSVDLPALRKPPIS